MACCFRHFKVPFNHSYLSFKTVTLRVQSCPSLFPSNDRSLLEPCPRVGLRAERKTLKTAIARKDLVGTSVFTSTTSNPTAELTELVANPLDFPGLQRLTTHLNSTSSLYSNSSVDSCLQSELQQLTDNLPFLSRNAALPLNHDNVLIATGFLESSPYLVYSVGPNGKSRPKSPTLSESESYSLQCADASKLPTVHATPGRASEEQLAKTLHGLAETLPRFFTRSHDYRLYSQDVIFENNFRGVTSRGLAQYMQQLVFVKFVANIRYANVKMHVLKMTQHPEDGTVKVRWRVSGISGFRVIFMFWKFRIWKWKEMMSSAPEWSDGFSIFHVGSDGLIYKHVCDKMMPDQNIEKVDPSVAVKFAVLLGLVTNGEGTLFTQQLECPQLLP